MELISTSFQCNNHCIFCAQKGLSAEKFAKDENTLIQKTLEVVGRDSKIAFVGGEPTLHPGLMVAVSAAKEAGASHVLVQTNGRRLAYESFARSLKDAGVSALDISLQGSTPTMHDYHTQVSGSWAQTILGIKRARELGFTIGVSTVITRSNFRHLTEIARLAHHLGAKGFHLNLALPYGEAGKSWARVIPSAEMAGSHLEEAVNLSKNLGLSLLVLGRVFSEDTRDLFAGIGLYQPAEKGTVPFSQKKGTVPFSRPKPGLRERRGTPRTGLELQKLFPEIFTGDELIGGKPPGSAPK